MVSQCGFDSRFSNDQGWWAFFHMFAVHINVFFWKVSVHIFSPLFDGVVFFSCKFVLVLCRLWILALCQMSSLQNFFPFCWLPVHSNASFAVQKLLSVIRSPLSILAFVAIAFGVLVMKSLPMPMSWMVLPEFSSRIFMVLGLMFKSLIPYATILHNLHMYPRI